MLRSRGQLSGKASETGTLLRLLPQIVGSYIPPNEYWNCYILLREVVDVTMSQIFLVHYPSLMLKYWPLLHLSCICFEEKNQFFKKVSTVVCNFKNITKSRARRHQLTQCWEQTHWIWSMPCLRILWCPIKHPAFFGVGLFRISCWKASVGWNITKKLIPSQLTIQLIKLANANWSTLYTLKRFHYFSRSKQYMDTVVCGTCLVKFSLHSHLTVISMHTKLWKHLGVPLS